MDIYSFNLGNSNLQPTIIKLLKIDSYFWYSNYIMDYNYFVDREI